MDSFAQDQKLRLCFYKIHDDCTVILGCVVITELLDCDAYMSEVLILKLKLLKNATRISSTSILDDLMAYVEHHATDPDSPTTLMA